MKHPGELFASAVFLATFAAAMSAVADSGSRRSPIASAPAVGRVAGRGDGLRRKNQAATFLQADSRPVAVAQTGATPTKDPR